MEYVWLWSHELKLQNEYVLRQRGGMIIRTRKGTHSNWFLNSLWLWYCFRSFDGNYVI